MTRTAFASIPAYSPAYLAESRPLGVMVQFFGLGIAAAAIDLWTKALAVQHLSWDAYTLGDRFALFLVINTGAAGGVSLGEHTWLINVVGTFATILLATFTVMPLARIAPLAATAMGLIAGGASGNLLSLLSSARGVPDFLALRLESAAIVFNIADIALWLGALLLIPIGVRVYRMARQEQRVLAEQSSRAETARALRPEALTGRAR